MLLLSYRVISIANSFMSLLIYSCRQFFVIVHVSEASVVMGSTVPFKIVSVTLVSLF